LTSNTLAEAKTMSKWAMVKQPLVPATKRFRDAAVVMFDSAS
jgi:hypothetical protein